jgi:HK97 family phage portal protein
MGKGGYAYIKKNGNKFVGLFYVEDSKIVVQKNTDAIYKSFSIMVDGGTYKNHEFLKVLRNTKDGASGTGLTEEISQALQTASRRLRYEYELTATGGSRKGFLTSEKHLDKKAIDALKTAWENYYSGNANTVVLNDGIKFQEASNSSQQNEMSQKTIGFADEMREIFHINANYDDFIKNAIMPIATAFSTALNRDFLLEKEKATYYFAPDTKELLKGSLRERYEAYRIAITTGFKTRNEIRYMEDDDAIEGLDMITLGLGEVLLNAGTGEIYTPNTNTVAKMGASGTETANLAPNNEVLGEGV